ncbi:hypothetical protein PILCRDRAFT_237386 [Piloderma croceum F 1598]|uniref:Uncharacterized protein n=1 Tax=Piloderma croceum (strain F 1598) TaxID=765440 RepID=A0A0C3GDN3_PILCF|nr:hypothetical protein PILCRDRAFT_237386 [Piloderma croceum F 1598]
MQRLQTNRRRRARLVARRRRNFHVLRGSLSRWSRGRAAQLQSHTHPSSRFLTRGHLTRARQDERWRSHEEYDDERWIPRIRVDSHRRHDTTQDHLGTSLRRNRSHRSPSFMSGARALRRPAGAILFFHPFFILVDCPMYIPIRDHPSVHLKVTTT